MGGKFKAHENKPAGLAPTTWDSSGASLSAYRTAERLNLWLREAPERAFEAGVMLSGLRPLLFPSVAWAHSLAEVAFPWERLGGMPFHQVHGHLVMWQWKNNRPAYDMHPEQQAKVVKVDHELRHVHLDVGSMRQVSVDPGHSKTPAKNWGPLTFEAVI
jgi:hypothetical protein